MNLSCSFALLLDPGEAGCEVPYWRLGDECYYVNQHLRVSWSEARLFCRGLGSDLAQPGTVAKLRAALLMRYRECPIKILPTATTTTYL